MKRVIYEAPTPTCDPNHVVTQDDLNKLEKHLDMVWNKLGIDIAFTKHFLDRVNDARNGRQITLCELARIFIETFRQHGKKLTTISAREWEAVLTDKTTNVNVPFVLKHNGKEVEIVAKTVMRKPNFFTPDPKLMVAHYSRNGENSMKNQKDAKPPIGSKTLREWAGFGLPQVDPVGGMSAADDVNVNTTKIEDPEVLNMLNGFLASLCQRQFINPYYPIHLAWIKLSAVNLSFPIRGLDLGGDGGVVYVPVAHQGGRLGKNLDGSWADNDGISEKIPGGLMLKIEYSLVEGMYSVALTLCTDDQMTDLEADDEVELDMTDVEEDVQTGTSDYSTADYPFDKTFQPTQDGETLFDAFWSGKDAECGQCGHSKSSHTPQGCKSCRVMDKSDFNHKFRAGKMNEAERPKVKPGRYGGEWPSAGDWTTYYKGIPFASVLKARQSTEQGIDKTTNNLTKKAGLRAKLQGINAAIQSHPDAGKEHDKYEKQKAKERGRAENFQSFMTKGRKIVEASNNIVVKPSSRKKGMYDVFVGGIHRITKPTVKGANGYASRIQKENPELHFTPYKES